MQKISSKACQEVKDAIANANAITILTHLNPDADTLGTGLGIYQLLSKEKNKKVEIVNASNALPKHLDFLPNYQKIKSTMEYQTSVVFTCDGGSIERFGFDLKGRKIINIDHHQSNTRYGDINIVIEEYASASQVAYALFKAFYTIDTKASTCFYTALFSDTRHFTTSSVNQEVFSVATALVEAGAKPKEIAHHLTQRASLASLRILQCALDTLLLHNDASIATLYVSKLDQEATGATMSDMDGIVDYASSLATVEIAIFAMESVEGIRVSLRSKTSDISKVALAFGGGGHKVASGFTLKQGGLQETIDKILIEIDRLALLV